MQRYLSYVAVTLLTAACTSSIDVPGISGDDNGGPAGNSGASSGSTGGIDPVTGEPIPGDGTNSSGTSGGSGTTGSGGPGPGNPGEPGSGTDPSVPSTPLANCDTPGPRMIRRLTSEQYANTLKQLMGDGFPVEQVLSDP